MVIEEKMYVCVCMWRAGRVWKISVLSAQFFSEPNTTLRNKTYFLRKKEKNPVLHKVNMDQDDSYLITVKLEIDSTL